MINVNDFRQATDNETIELAMKNRQSDGIVVIPPRESDVEPERNYWLLDRAILIPENTTVVLQNCTIKLSDRCRDNFFRTANCGLGMDEAEKIYNVHLRGEGTCTLLGADHPRASGDSSMTLACPCPYLEEELLVWGHWIPEERRQPGKLDFWDAHNHSYGTDAGKEGESQRGDWRGIGVLFANVENFSIENLRIVKSHGWAISLEACTHGRVEKIELDACMFKEIDGMLSNMENQDGVDLRNGCHHITVSDITGTTGDDMVALTAIARDGAPYVPGGSLCSTHVMHNDFSRRDRDIHDVIIRNVHGYSQRWNVRLLSCNTHIWNVVIDGVIDSPVEGLYHLGTVLLGDNDGEYGKNLKDGLSNITISNMICHGRIPITVKGYLKDSVISNIVNRNPEAPVIRVDRENGMSNVQISNIVTVGEKIIG